MANAILNFHFDYLHTSLRYSDDNNDYDDDDTCRGMFCRCANDDDDDDKKSTDNVLHLHPPLLGRPSKIFSALLLLLCPSTHLAFLFAMICKQAPFFFHMSVTTRVRRDPGTRPVPNFFSSTRPVPARKLNFILKAMKHSLG